jgi:hypothetical protein
MATQPTMDMGIIRMDIIGHIRITATTGLTIGTAATVITATIVIITTVIDTGTKLTEKSKIR